MAVPRLLCLSAAVLLATACAIDGGVRDDESQTAESAPADDDRVMASSFEDEAWLDDIMDWRQRRLDRLTEPYGYLSLTGLDFVADGSWLIGAGDEADIRMPAGPARWGVLQIEGSAAYFEPAPVADVEVDGRRVEHARIDPRPDADPVFVSAADARFQMIRRNDALAVRTRWPQARSRTEFIGLDYFPPDPEWRIEARFEHHPPGTTIEIGSVLDDVTDEPNLGRAVFDIDGREFSLEAIGEADDEELFFIIADRTSGRETYGAGRFLYADAPVDGRIVLDFNRAYNPPCAFNEYTTCPLPPPENRMNIRVEAGELDYAGDSGL